MPAPLIIDPFHKMLHDALQAKVATRSEFVLTGGPATIEQYREQVAYLNAIAEVLSLCHELERQRYGEPGGQA